MKTPPPLPPDALAAALREAEGWTLAAEGTAIAKAFRFKTFRAAFGWMRRCADAAEEMNHHPDWRNVYNRVEVSLTTHSAGALTELDFRLAAKMDALFAEGQGETA